MWGDTLTFKDLSVIKHGNLVEVCQGAGKCEGGLARDSYGDVYEWNKQRLAPVGKNCSKVYSNEESAIMVNKKT